jgi:uncharacterized protein involved in exopolysaccharide biosynthesis
MTSSPSDAQGLSVIGRDVRVVTGRDLVRPLFRYRRCGLTVFICSAVVVALAVLLWPATYRAEMTILVKRERIDPVVTTGRDVSQQARLDVSDSDLYSAVELLKSRDLLEAVVLASALAPTSKGTKPDQTVLARAVKSLQKDLEVTPLKKTTLIRVTYTSDDPQRAARVLSDLARLYFDKHLSTHRPPGAQQFFKEQTTRLRQELDAARARLVEFGQQHHVVSAASERDNALQRLSEFEVIQAQLRAQVADADHRADALRQQMSITPMRQTTLLRTQDNGELVRDLTSQALALDLKRTDLVRKFEPAYPPLMELEQQLSQTRAALSSAQQAPIREEVTDQNPTHQWLRDDLARVVAERQALGARLEATERTIRQYRAKARELSEQESVQQELIRAAKTGEDTVDLYERKAEEARIADALDQTRITNVALAEAPTVPALPSGLDRWLLLVGGFACAFLCGIGTTFALERVNPCFRTRHEIQEILDLPVLAALPASLPE